MARKPESNSPKLPRKAQDFISHLRRSLRSKLPDSALYLTGSLARGDWVDDSDIDLIVVSKKFRGMDIGNRYRLIKELSRPGFSLEVLAYTPEEFRRTLRRSIILEDMMEYTKKIA